ncbi:penicillin-binding protein 1A [Oxalobacteraceae bacterium OM1]|nr:penicillin-binding protein 1A [Oxalobacteraceae bacterium OM1]
MKLVYAGLAGLGLIAAGAALVFVYAVLIVGPMLPSIDALTDYQPKMPLRIYTADNVLIGEFGEEHRDFVAIKEMPVALKRAVLAIEDDRFYEHGGVSYLGVLRAGLANLRASRSQGASTITMQVARTFFLSRKKTYNRKINEIMLAFKIEDNLSKDQILELYMNQIYLGERAYGFGSAARIYFGKPVQKLTLAEAAMLAGLPQSPAAANPVVNPERAKQRQMQVLKRMRDLQFITPAQYEQAAAENIQVLGYNRRFTTHAEYAAELVRQYMVSQYSEDVYTRGYSVVTTLRQADQDAAYEALRRGVTDYDRRHGYRGPEDYIDLPRDADDRRAAIDEVLLKHPDSDELRAAVVLSASSRLVRAELLSGEIVEVRGEGLRFAAGALSGKGRSSQSIRPGTVIRVVRDAKKAWGIGQLPEVEAALVALDAANGAYRALVGGFDFNANKLDHVTQAWRQPGSSIKPFVYSAALEKGFGPGSLINDAPISIEAGGQTWEPQNDDGRYDGPIAMRTGLKKSKNMVSIRVLRTITPNYARDYLGRFGFDVDKHPANLTMALGTGSVTPVQLAAGYAVFANGGYQVVPYLIQRIADGKGKVLVESHPTPAGNNASRVLDARNVFLMDSMLRDVTHSGTGYLAGQRLGRADIAGKTGTTNDAVDGWFAGYGGNVVAVAWMGYDKPRSLGGREFGATLALPIWSDYMRVALRGVADVQRAVPEGLAQVNGDWAYQEYANGNAVRSVDVEDNRSFWDKLFGQPAQPGQAPAPAQQQEPQRQREKERESPNDMTYRG